MKPLKNTLRSCWIEDLRQQLRARVPEVPFKLTPPDRAKIASWVGEAWESLSPETIKNGCKKCDVHTDELLAGPELISALSSLSMVDSAIESDDDFQTAESDADDE